MWWQLIINFKNISFETNQLKQSMFKQMIYPHRNFASIYIKIFKISVRIRYTFTREFSISRNKKFVIYRHSIDNIGRMPSLKANLNQICPMDDPPSASGVLLSSSRWHVSNSRAKKTDRLSRILVVPSLAFICSIQAVISYRGMLIDALKTVTESEQNTTRKFPSFLDLYCFYARNKHASMKSLVDNNFIYNIKSSTINVKFFKCFKF